MARLPFAIQSYRHRSLPVSAQRLINWFAEMEPKDARSPIVLLPTPGLTLYVTLPAGPVRGVRVMGSYLYAVAGGNCYRVDVAGNVVALGSVTPGGPVVMADNGDQVCIVIPETREGFVATASSLTQITASGFTATGATSVTVIDGYGVFTKPDSSEFFLSAQGDLLTYNGDEADAEGDPDNLVVARRVGRELWLFGERTTEIWSNTGAADFPFQRISGAFVERGCAARFSVAQRLGVPFWLGDDRVIYKGSGAAPERISTHAVEQEIGGYEVVSDARSWIYEQEGHVFYCISFPSGGATFVFDMITGVWHERDSEGYEHWRCATGAAFAGATVAGDLRDGRLYIVDPTAYDEVGQEIIRVATGSPLHGNGKRVRFKSLTFDLETGTGLTTGQGSDPKCWLQISDDGGRTFGNEIWRDLGARGAHRTRVRFSQLGAARDRVFRFGMADPVRTAISAVDIEAEPQRS
ncbi:MAG: hypothetical protein KGR68_03750 [Betaproteobacteria bacterium]|nr:hypothetical protein [Betaproteobacteria bacterium]